MAVIKNNRILKCLLLIVVSLLLVLNFSIWVSASSGYDRQETDTCITISERLSVKGGKYSEEEIEFILKNIKGDGFKNNPLRLAYVQEVRDWV